MALHMALGSALAVLGIACPAIISFGTAAGIAPLAAALIAYTSVSLHWLLPFHHMNLLVGCGDDGGGFEKKDVLRLGVPQTAVAVSYTHLTGRWPRCSKTQSMQPSWTAAPAWARRGRLSGWRSARRFKICRMVSMLISRPPRPPI